MKRRFLGAVSATAIALSAAMAAPVLAQTQLEDSVMRELAELGVDTASMTALSAEQVAQIQNVLGSGDPDDQKVARIEQIIAANPGTGVGQWGVGQLQDSVSAELAALGVEANVEAMTLAELAQIENVASTTDSPETKVQRIRQILGTNPGTGVGRWGVGQLQDSVAAELAALPVDGVDVEALTLTQLAQIENVVNTTDGPEEKARRIEQILTR